MRAFVVSLIFFSVETLSEQIHRKFEYKHSFRGPNLSQKDGTVPFWDIQGDALASSEQIRLAPSMRSKRGGVWNKKPMLEAEFWEAELTFKVTGQGRIGADGLGFWYTAKQGHIGPVFGGSDFWTGLGIFFDSFDNDAQRNNPYILMMVNDGTRSFDHQTDGSRQMITGCQKDFRNRPYPVKLKIEYLRNVLQVLINDGMTPHERYELCMRAENIFLPKDGHFGLSAATGGLADDHDVIAFNVFSLMTEAPKPPGMIPPEEQKKFEKEFEDQWKKFEEEKERFKKEHPEKAKKEEEYEKFFEDATGRELRLIYESQNAIHNVMQQLEAKLNQIVQQQNQHTHMLNQAKGTGVQGAAGGGGDGFQRHEVDELLRTSRDMNAVVREIKTYAADVYSRTINLEQKLSGQVGIASVQSAGTGSEQVQFSTMKGYLEGIKQDVEQIRVNQRTGGAGGMACPTPPPCLSPTIFFLAVAAQSAVLLLFLLYRKGNDKAKFY